MTSALATFAAHWPFGRMLDFVVVFALAFWLL
jgi:hypothetical protein